MFEMSYTGFSWNFYRVVNGGSDSELGVFMFPNKPRSYLDFPNHLPIFPSKHLHLVRGFLYMCWMNVVG